ncbi:MAG: hypothetical protein ACREBM_06720, partial [Sphingomicrobium sp.]
MGSAGVGTKEESHVYRTWRTDPADHCPGHPVLGTIIAAVQAASIIINASQKAASVTDTSAMLIT